MNKPSLITLMALLFAVTAMHVYSSAPAQSKSKPDSKILQADITTQVGDRAVYHEGDHITLLLSLNKPAYVILIYKNSHGEMNQIYPNAYQSQSKHAASAYQPIPSERANYKFVAGPPFGKDQVWLLAAEKPLPDWRSWKNDKSIIKNYKLWSKKQNAKVQIRTIQLTVKP